MIQTKLSEKMQLSLTTN